MGKKKDNDEAELTEEEKAENNDAVWDEIYYYQGKVEEYTEKICDFNEKLTELEALKQALLSTHMEFEERHRLRKDSLFQIAGRKGNINMVNVYTRGMEDFLNGTDYGNVCRYYEDASSAVSEKIQYFYDETLFFKDEINRCEDLISYWYGRLV